MFDLNNLKVDPDKASNGAWVKYYGGTELCIARGNNEDAEQYRIEQAIEHADLFQAGGEKAEEKAFEVETYVLAHFVLKDWEGITVDGEAVDYSPEVGMKYLADPAFKEFRDDVIRFSRNREHFRTSNEKLAADTVKTAAAS